MTANRLYQTAFRASMVAMLALMAVRLYYGISFAEPLQFITSGDEQASMFAIWKAVNGLPVYSDPTRSPYSMSFYNALFYDSYGAWTGFWLKQLSLADAWLPTVARVFTLLGVIAGWAAAFYLLRGAASLLAPAQDRTERLVAILGAAVLFVGPMMGFWAFTVRPDIWAHVFEVLGVLALVATYGTNKHRAVTLTALAFVAAWLFKQAAISAVCGVGLFLLLEREWRALFLYCAVYLGICLTIIFTGDALYQQSLFFSQIELEYSLAHGIKVWGNAVAKTLPVYLPLLVVVYALIRSAAYRQRFASHWVCRFFLVGFVAAAGVIFVLSLQNASAENYIFAPNLFAAGLLVTGFACMREEPSLHAVLGRTWVGAAAVQTVLCVLVLGGVIGVLDAAKKSHPAWVETAACINRFDKPVFAEGTYLSLPWMVKNDEPFVLSFTYDRARAIGLAHEKDGIGGRIASGEFATLALSTASRDGGFDGADLRNYELTGSTCGGLHIWSKIAP